MGSSSAGAETPGDRDQQKELGAGCVNGFYVFVVKLSLRTARM